MPNAIIGNPPYQVMDKGNASSDAAAPIYQKFVEVAKKLLPQYISMIIPSKWMVGGRSELLSFLNSMKEDYHLSFLKDYRNDRSIFPSAHNDGGICYFLWDVTKREQKVDYTYVTMDGKEYKNQTLLKNKFSTYIIRDMRVLPILEKIYEEVDPIEEQHSFCQIISKSRPFGLRKDLFNVPEKYPNLKLQLDPCVNGIKIYGVKGYKGGAKRVSGYINNNGIVDKHSALKKHKIFFTTTYSSDATIPPSLIKAFPNEICTETFLLVGPFNTEVEMDNCASYMTTDFFRFLLFLGHGTMQVNKSVFKLIPIQDFSRHWSDEDLYRKYKLTKDEIAYIESVMKPKE